MYVDETSRHFSTRVRKHLFGDMNSHVYKDFQGSENCKNPVDESSFEIIDSASSDYQLRFKGGQAYRVTKA